MEQLYLWHAYGAAASATPSAPHAQDLSTCGLRLCRTWFAALFIQKAARRSASAATVFGVAVKGTLGTVVILGGSLLRAAFSACVKSSDQKARPGVMFISSAWATKRLCRRCRAKRTTPTARCGRQGEVKRELRTTKTWSRRRARSLLARATP